MDNVIWIVLSAAVFLALAGMLLYIGGDSLTNADNSAEDIQDPDPYIDDSYTDNSNLEERSSSPTNIEYSEIEISEAKVYG